MRCRYVGASDSRKGRRADIGLSRPSLRIDNSSRQISCIIRQMHYTQRDRNIGCWHVIGLTALLAFKASEIGHCRIDV
jgi:hypothetical protein